MVRRQSPRNQTLYADLLQEALSSTLPEGRGISFTRKTVKGRRYWYLSVAVGRKRMQAYLGPVTPEMDAQIEVTKARWADARSVAHDRSRLVAHLVNSGATATPAASGAVLATLADGGVFRAGAVLIGTVAFQAYANMLGVRWPGGELRTQDIDIAAGAIGLAVSQAGVNLTEILEQTAPLVSIPGLFWKDQATSFESRGQRIDLLTPMIGPESSKPVFVKRLGAYAEPLRFLDFLMEDAQPAVLLAKDGIAVNVPDPARFAVHKLVISQRRPAAWATKARKDLLQAASLIEVLLEDMPGALVAGLDASRAYHEKFHSTVLQAAKQLPNDLGKQLLALRDGQSG